MSIFDRDRQDGGALPADVAELLARGSGHVEHLDPEVRARLRARLLSPASSVGRASSDEGRGAGASPAASAGAGRIFLANPLAVVLTTFALGLGSGALLHGWLRPGAAPAPGERSARWGEPLPAQAPPPAILPVAPAPELPRPAAPPIASSARPAPAPRGVAHDREDDRALARERALLEQARAALMAGDAGQALAALDRHRRTFPEGRLAEERDVLRVRALLAVGRAREAQAEAERFLRKHPASLFRPAVEQAIAKTDSRAAPNEVTGGHE